MKRVAQVSQQVGFPKLLWTAQLLIFFLIFIFLQLISHLQLRSNNCVCNNSFPLVSFLLGGKRTIKLNWPCNRNLRVLCSQYFSYKIAQILLAFRCDILASSYDELRATIEVIEAKWVSQPSWRVSSKTAHPTSSSTSACELEVLSMYREVIFSLISFQNYVPNLTNPIYLTKGEVSSQKFFTTYSEKQASNFWISLTSSATTCCKWSVSKNTNCCP